MQTRSIARELALLVLGQVRDESQKGLSSLTTETLLHRAMETLRQHWRDVLDNSAKYLETAQQQLLDSELQESDKASLTRVRSHLRESIIAVEDALNSLSSLLNAKFYNNEISLDAALQNYNNALDPYIEIIDKKHLQIETWYNKENLFIKSISLYIGAFFLLVISWMIKPVLLRRIAFTTLLLGLGFHLYGIILRIIIMQRPPISTLYESVIFVNLIGII